MENITINLNNCIITHGNYITKPKTFANGQRYTAQLSFSKSNVENKNAYDAAFNFATQKGIDTCWGGHIPAEIINPLKDKTIQNGECLKEGYVLNATNKTKPQVVDAKLANIINQEEIYSGITANVNIELYPYFYEGKAGIACKLHAVQKIRDGEKPNTINASEVFKVIETDPVTGEAI